MKEMKMNWRRTYLLFLGWDRGFFLFWQFISSAWSLHWAMWEEEWEETKNKMVKTMNKDGNGSSTKSGDMDLWRKCGVRFVHQFWIQGWNSYQFNDSLHYVNHLKSICTAHHCNIYADAYTYNPMWHQRACRRVFD
jgi:hypothetical protein